MIKKKRERESCNIVPLQGCTLCTSTLSFIIAAYPYGWPIFWPLTYRAPVGIQVGCNHDGRIPQHTHTPHTTLLHALIIIVTSGATVAPVGPQTFPRRASPGSTQLHRNVCIYGSCDICSFLCERLKADECLLNKRMVEYVMPLLGEALGMDIRVAPRVNAP